MTNSKIQYSPREELVNFITHLPGVFFGLFASIVLVQKFYGSGDLASLFSYLVYGSSLTLLFIASSSYHKVKCQDKKKFFKKVDHACIFLFMAGCYTPFVVLNMEVSWKYWFLALIWVIAGFGVLYKFLSKHKNIYLSVGLYIAFAYMCFLAKKDMLDAIPKQAFDYLAIGGVFYTVGAGFYVMKKVPYHHAVWHVLVLLGAVSHFLAVYHTA